MAYLQKPAHQAICIDTRLAAKFLFFYHAFPQKSLRMLPRAWRKCGTGARRQTLAYACATALGSGEQATSKPALTLRRAQIQGHIQE